MFCWLVSVPRFFVHIKIKFLPGLSPVWFISCFKMSLAVNSSNVFLASGWTVCWNDSYRANADNPQRNRTLSVRQEAKYVSEYYRFIMDESFHTKKHSNTLYMIWLIEDAAYI